MGALSQTLGAGGLVGQERLTQALFRLGQRAARWTEICAADWCDDDPELLKHVMRELVAATRAISGPDAIAPPILMVSVKLAGKGDDAEKAPGARLGNGEISAALDAFDTADVPGVAYRLLPRLDPIREQDALIWAKNVPPHIYDRQRLERRIMTHWTSMSQAYPMSESYDHLMDALQATIKHQTPR